MEKLFPGPFRLYMCLVQQPNYFYCHVRDNYNSGSKWKHRKINFPFFIPQYLFSYFLKLHESSCKFSKRLVEVSYLASQLITCVTMAASYQQEVGNREKGQHDLYNYVISQSCKVNRMFSSSPFMNQIIK